MLSLAWFSFLILALDIPSQVHWAPGVSMVEAPILNIMLLAALYLPAPDWVLEPVPPPDSEPEPINDFLVQKPASTWPDRREVARRAVNGDGKGKKPRIVKMRGGIKEKKKGNKMR